MILLLSTETNFSRVWFTEEFPNKGAYYGNQNKKGLSGGASPDGAKLVVRFATPMEEYVDYARKIINIEEPVPEPKK